MGVPKVLIFTITYAGKDYVFDEFLERSLDINYPNKKHIVIDNSNDNNVYTESLRKRLPPDIEVYHVERGNNSREALAKSQNFARKYALENDYDYMFSLESDILVEPTIIQDLMFHSKPIVGALYMIGDRRKGQRVPCITLPKKTDIGLLGTRLLARDEWDKFKNKGLQRVASCGLGATLIKKDIFQKFNFYYHPDLKGHSDIFFYNELFNSGIPAYVDTDIEVEHKNVVWAENVQDI